MGVCNNMQTRYIINGHEIAELIDLLCVIPPTLVDPENLRSNERTYIHWKPDDKNLWVSAYVYKDFSGIAKTIEAHPEIRNKRSSRLILDEESAALERLIELVCIWCDMTKMYNTDVVKIEEGLT
jgi:hypothetical protein